ncbi:Uncharacterised protein [Mycoplasmopsis edwardii]|uniref:Uncharacterized protein n=1 Tax=Mycoplasmopsis edwardii TaxID=53558 RepID=A0A3B0PTU0_9BACT|nr:Uncharacterised protein [Mycoplasmopsis edwardii]
MAFVAPKITLLINFNLPNDLLILNFGIECNIVTIIKKIALITQ